MDAIVPQGFTDLVYVCLSKNLPQICMITTEFILSFNVGLHLPSTWYNCLYLVMRTIQSVVSIYTYNLCYIYITHTHTHVGFPGGSAWGAGDAGRHGLHPQVRKTPRRKTRQPTSIILPGESRAQRTLEGYSP